MEIAKLILEYLRTLVWPTTVIVLSLLFRREITRVFARLNKAVLPGGFSFDLREEVQEVKQLSEKVQSAPPSEKQKATPSIPLTAANARMMRLGLAPTLSGLDISYYRAKVETDPVLALAGLRIDLETLARNLAIGFKLQPSGSLYTLLGRLKEAGAITLDQAHLGLKISKVCNQAMHGELVSGEEAEDVIDAAEILFQQYLAWLSWGFDDNWKPSSS
jgi:hypothetical protein